MLREGRHRPCTPQRPVPEPDHHWRARDSTPKGPREHLATSTHTTSPTSRDPVAEKGQGDLPTRLSLRRNTPPGLQTRGCVVIDNLESEGDLRLRPAVQLVRRAELGGGSVVNQFDADNLQVHLNEESVNVPGRRGGSLRAEEQVVST